MTAARHQDVADVVARVKPLDEGGYLEVVSHLRPELRAQLLRLRRDALDELALDDRSR